MRRLPFSEPIRNQTDRMQKWLIVLICLLGISTTKVLAQDPCFQFVGDSLGCAPFTVTVRNCTDPSAIISFNFRWKVNPNPIDYQVLPAGETEMSYTYTEPGEYIIEQLRGGNQTLQRRVRVFRFEAVPKFTWETCRDTLKIRFIDTVFTAYTFEPGDGGPALPVVDKASVFKYKYNFTGSQATFPFEIRGAQPNTCNKEPQKDTVTLYKNNEAPLADSLIGIDSLKYRVRMQTRADEPWTIQVTNGTGFWNNLVSGNTPVNRAELEVLTEYPTARNPDSLRLATISGCGNVVPAPAWTLFWLKTRPDNQKIQLTWPRMDLSPLEEMELLRNGIPIKNLIGYPDTQYVDTSNLVCGQLYCYQIRTKRNGSGHGGKLVFLTAPSCANAVSNRPPDPVTNLHITVENNQISVSGLASPLAKTFEVFRKTRAAMDYELWKNVGSLPFVDSTINVSESSYCYRIQYRDICANPSLLSDSICSIHLQQFREETGLQRFNWTTLTGWKDGVARYRLIRLNPPDPAKRIAEGRTLQSFETRQRDSYKQRIEYQVGAFANDSILYPEGSFSNVVVIDQEAGLRFPDVFTPNDDGWNDVFKGYGLYLTEFNLEIFNAWGNLIWVGQSLKEGWNGEISGQPAPSGPYAYKARGKDEQGASYQSTGYFNLVR